MRSPLSLAQGRNERRGETSGSLWEKKLLHGVEKEQEALIDPWNCLSQQKSGLHQFLCRGVAD
jgi:hypothetical protein